MKFKYTIHKSEPRPSNGMWFALENGNVYGLDQVEEAFNLCAGELTSRTYNAIVKRFEALQWGEWLLLEVAA